MKLTVLCAVALGAFSCLPVHASSESWQKIKCKRALKSSLRDPGSLKIPWGGIVAGGDVVRIDYRARNGFGGMNSSRFYCEFSGDTLLRVVND